MRFAQRQVMLTPALLAFVLAQTLSVTLPPDKPFEIQFDHPLELTTGFRWWCDGNIVKNFTKDEAVKAPVLHPDGTYTWAATAPGLPIGTHVCFVSAYDFVEAARGEFKGDPAAITVATTEVPAAGKVHAAPVRLVIVVKIGGGQP